MHILEVTLRFKGDFTPTGLGEIMRDRFSDYNVEVTDVIANFTKYSKRVEVTITKKENRNGTS